MLATLSSCALHGIDAYAVEVEVAISGGLPGYHVVGLPATSVREGAVRIRSALEHVGAPMPSRKIIVNLAPADRRKSGAAFDLAIAVGIAVVNGRLPVECTHGTMILGELGLDASLRPVRGALAAAALAKRMGLTKLIVPMESAPEAAEVGGLDVFGAGSLGEVIAALAGDGTLRKVEPQGYSIPESCDELGDFSDVRGQEFARTALEVAVAGGHNVLLTGPPGIGKTMLARRVPTILPPLSRDEALETTRVLSSVGASRALIRQRPFRAPHHTISAPALVGGGNPPVAGEISLAHNGVLFLDELPEFSRTTLESLRQPLEDRQVTIGRVRSTVTLPAAFLLVASANPCPCGWLGSRDRVCTDSVGAIERYRAKLSGPLLDRIDLQVHVPNVALSELRSLAPGESSNSIRQRVLAARALQQRRLAPHGYRTNAEMDSRAMRKTCILTDAAEASLRRLYKVRQAMTGRSVDRIIKVARTIADLEGKTDIDAECILEAAAYRAVEMDPIVDVRQYGPQPRSIEEECAE